MATDYADIYDRIITSHEAYNRAENSPGFRAVVRYLERLRMCGGPVLDVGCGVGFALEYLAQEMPGSRVHGCDVSRVAIERASARLAPHGVGSDRLRVIQGGRLPFDDSAFGLAICFDVVEHIEEADLPRLKNEIERVLRPGGWSVISVALRAASTLDHRGENAHLTVRPVEWWMDLFDPDEALVDRRRREAIFWRRKPETKAT